MLALSAMRTIAREQRAILQRRGAVPKDVPWEKCPKASKRMYRKEARAILSALAPRQHPVPPTSREPGKVNIHEELASAILGMSRVLRCERCGGEERLNSASRALATGWPECCGETMRWLTNDEAGVPPTREDSPEK